MKIVTITQEQIDNNADRRNAAAYDDYIKEWLISADFDLSKPFKEEYDDLTQEYTFTQED